MSVPKRHKTKSSINQRRSHHALKTTSFSLCPKCGKEILKHTMCAHCGYYKGKEVVNVLEKLTKKEKKMREKEMKAKEKEGKASESAKEEEKKEVSK